MSKRGKSRRAEEVPQWVRDFITQRQKQKPEEREGQASHNTYLLCPFNQGEVEAIRAGIWKLREEASTAYIKESGFDSGFSINDDFFETYLRQLLHTLLSRQEMQEAVAKYYRWGKWSEDPWGDFSKFCEWINSISDDERDVWAINETFGGRVYLTYWILRHLSQFNYSEITEKDLITCIGVGAENFLRVKSYTSWDDFNYHYPKEPLPASFVNEQIIKVYLTCPFRGFRWFINSIYLWDFALNEARERAKGHPELEGFLDYHAATDTRIAELCRKLAPKDYRFPDKNQAWGKLEQALKKGLEAIAANYDDVYPLRSEHHDILKESYLTAEEGLVEGVKYWKSKAYEAAVAGLKGRLGNSLLSIVKHDFADAVGKAYRKHEVTESQIDATRVTDEGDATPFLDTIPSLEPMPEEPIDLKELGFNIDKLKPKELWVIRDVLQGFKEGYSFDSKQGQSFRQRWGDNYQANKRAWQRAKARLKSK